MATQSETGDAGRRTGSLSEERGGAEYMAPLETEVRRIVEESGRFDVQREDDVIHITMGSDPLFDTDSAEIKIEGFPEVDELAALLGRHHGIRIKIVCHTDSIGSEAHNLGLTEKRAQAVVKAFTDRGVSPDRMTAVGLGEGYPVSHNATETGRRRNRRIVVDLMPTTGS